MPRALPLLYPAAPPSVFAFGKYTAPAVALVREYEVGFLWVILVEIMVWGFSTRETTGGVARTSLYSGLVVLALFVDLAIHLPCGFQPLFCMHRGSASIILDDLTSKSSSIGFQPLLYMPRGSAPIIPRGSAFRI